jgi:hypothetical protein
MQENKQISWRVHPVVDDFPRSLGAIVLLIFCSYLFALFTGILTFGLIAFMVFFLSTMSYFVPINYRIDEKNLIITFLGFDNVQPLSKYRNFYINPAGIHFSTFSTPSALDSFRGNFVRFNRNRQEVVSFLKEVMPDEVIKNSANISAERKDLFAFVDYLIKGKGKARKKD